MSDSNKIYTAAMIVIGDEILTGRTLDKNTQWIAQQLALQGIRLREARTIPDDHDTIVGTVNELRALHDYVFTTGGIGPTHDDITAQCVADAFGLEFGRNQQAYEILLGYYGPEELTEARLKMAETPEGAELIENKVSGAPGFRVENVYVFAGVPKIMQAMYGAVSVTLRGGKAMLSASVMCALQESVLAPGLGKIQEQYQDVQIGSYPSYRAGIPGVSLVARTTERDLLEQVTQDITDMVRALGDEPANPVYQGL